MTQWTASALQAWIADKLASELRVPAGEIDPRTPFSQYGLDSVTAVTLSADLEDLLGRTLEATLFWDYPTLEALVGFLVGATSQAPTYSPADEEQREAVAVVGLACRLPGGPDPEAFWQSLAQGIDSVGEIPRDRWGESYFDPDPDAPGKTYTKWAAFLEGVDRFDAPFFGISAREAISMDPQQRLLLEMTWEALERAGLPADGLAGSKTGVFVGISNSDYGRQLLMDPERMDVYASQGGAFSIASGRISYLFDFQGPNMAVDTACSSSLVALHLACESLRRHESSLALAGGVNLILSPEAHIGFSKARMMSPDGRCKTFDASANGYVRGEGAGMVVLKRLSEAKRDGDTILAVIRSTAVNQDGRSNGLTAPNAKAQQALLRQALENAGIRPEEVGYVEAHGTGTPLGDPIEVSSLKAVLGAPRPDGAPCVLGSVKTNIGHLESAAGIAGLIKTILALQHEAIPPHLHFKALNPHISLDGTPLVIPTELTPWPRGGKRRVAGVSSFGFSGTNAHIVLEEAPPVAAVRTPETQAPRLVPLSARSPKALTALARSFEGYLKGGSPAALADIAYTTSRKRAHHDHRLAIPATTVEELQERLGAYLAGQARGWVAGRKPAQAPKVAFVFSGQGPQWWAMGRELLSSEPVFRQVIEECDRLMRPIVDWSLLEELSADAERSRVQDTAIAQPALFAIQVALFALWRSWGIAPDAVVGHSVGEIAACHAAGVLSLEDAVKVACLRGRIMQQATGRGRMAAVELSADEASRALIGYEGKVALGAINSPTSVTLTGDPEPLEEVLSALSAKGAFCRPLKVNYAFHSHRLDPFQAELAAALADIAQRPATLSIVSTLTADTAATFDAAYWARQMREPVRFFDAVGRLVDEGHTVFVELAPHPVLALALEDGLRAKGKTGTVIASMRREQPEKALMLAGAGTLYTLGLPVEWQAVAPEGRFVQLPGYPWQRERYWFEASPRELSARVPRAEHRHPLLGTREESTPGEYHWEVFLSKDRPETRYFWEHQVNGVKPFPGTGYVDLALSAAADAFGPGRHALEGMRFRKFCMLQPDLDHTLHVFVSKQSDERAAYQVKSRTEDGTDWVLHAEGFIRIARADETFVPGAHEGVGQVQARCPETIEGPEYYQALLKRGFQHGPSFCGVEQIWRRDGEAIGLIRLKAPEAADAHDYQVHPALLDASLSVLFTTITREGGHEGDTRIFLGVDELRFFRHPGTAMWLHGIQRPDGVGVADAYMLDEAGNVVAEARGLRSHLLDTRTLAGGPASDAWHYELQWRPAALLAAKATPEGVRLILADSEVGPALAERLGAGCIVAYPGDRFEAKGPGTYTLRPDHPADFEALVAEALKAGAMQSVLHLWSLQARDLAEAKTFGASALPLAQALLKAGATARLYLVTREATAAGDPGQALLWGFGRTLMQEHPELAPTLLDLGAQDAPEAARLLADEVQAADVENQVAFRAGERLVARLSRREAPEPGLAPTLQEEASYLVTGGLGGIGLQVASWLAELGARHLVLTGRSAPSEAARGALDELRARGVQVQVIRADVARAEDVQRLLDAIEAGMPPLKGIMHAAGFLADATVLQLDLEQFDRVLGPKVDGSWHLHRLTEDMELDFFVMFSSAAALMGSGGQANYAAANAYMDALARHRAARGLCGLSINWGPWAEVGMGAAQANRGERLAFQGMASIESREGVSILGGLMGDRAVQVGVLPINWERWFQSFPALAKLPVLADLAKHAAARRPASAGQVRQTVLASAAEARTALLEGYLQAGIARILQLDPAEVELDAPLPSLGLDSLMSMELKNRLVDDLGMPISATVFWLYPTVTQLASHLAEELAKDGSAPAAAVAEVGTERVKVIPAQPEPTASVAIEPAVEGERDRMQFSLFFFSDNEAEFKDDKYSLYLEGAQFADREGFTAIWTPERHFHPFGGVYPSPSVLSSALAMVTERVRLRAGSVVLPLNHPVRVAEEWSVVDNLSGGRVDLAFTTGWNANDFLLRPENYARREAAFAEGIDLVRRLWRGEAAQLPNGKGEPAEFKVYPLPKQRELPVWVTASKGPDRFVQAGAMGANLLTALLLQSVEELAEKIALYRKARADNGHDPDAGQVTLMLHTFVGDDMASVRQEVRGPFIEYIKSSVELWSQFSKELHSLDEAAQAELLEVAFERYFRTSALFGTPDSCAAMVERLHGIGVTELACLIDFGVDRQATLRSLEHLSELRRRFSAPGKMLGV